MEAVSNLRQTDVKLAASDELEQAVEKLLAGSYEPIEHDQIDETELEAGCLSCS
jgi:hypothetical protein